MERLTLVLVVDLPARSVSAFRSYEDQVLPLLARHGGLLERRLRTADGRTEVHVLSFADQTGYQAYVEDPERAGHRTLLDGSPYDQRLLDVTDV
jgi:molybdopterin biosynthesis enzyme